MASYRDLVTVDVVDTVAIVAVLRGVNIIIKCISMWFMVHDHETLDESYTNCMKNRLYEDFLLAVVADLDDQAVAVVQCDHCSGGSMSVAAVVEMEAGRPTCS